MIRDGSKRVSVTLPASVLERLDELAGDCGLHRGHVIEAIVYQLLDGPPLLRHRDVLRDNLRRSRVSAVPARHDTLPLPFPANLEIGED